MQLIWRREELAGAGGWARGYICPRLTSPQRANVPLEELREPGRLSDVEDAEAVKFPQNVALSTRNTSAGRQEAGRSL